MFFKKLLTFFTTLAIFVLVMLAFLHPITAITQDLGRHILTGKIILQTLHVPKVNLFSYTYPSFSFINHHWFSEVVFYLTVQSIGFSGLLFVTTGIVLIAFALVFFYAKQKSTALSLFITSLLYFPVLFERTDVRPEIFSFLFLSIFIVILYRYREQYTKWIFLLLPLELLWVNMHIYFFVGIAVLGLFCVDRLFTDRHTLVSKTTVLLFTITLICSVITVLNPNGLQGALYPFSVLQNYGYSIEENQNIFFLSSLTHNSHIVFFEFAIIVLGINLLLGWKKTKPIDWFLSIIFSILGAWAIRNFPLFAFATFIPLTHALSKNIEYILSFLQKRTQIASFILENLLVLGIFLLLIWQIIDLFSTQRVQVNLPSGGMRAADFYITHHITGPVFNNFDIGSYLEYRLYPAQKVFVDGRPEAYPVSFFQNIYIPMQKNPAVFEQTDRQYHFNSIFFSHTDQTPWASQFMKDIEHNPHWKIVYVDDYSVILLKNTPHNKQLLQEYAMDEKSVRITAFPYSNSDDLLSLAHFFNEFGWTNQEAKIYQVILVNNPEHCIALYNYGLILQQNQLPIANAYIDRYNQHCR